MRNRLPGFAILVLLSACGEETPAPRAPAPPSAPSTELRLAGEPMRVEFVLAWWIPQERVLKIALCPTALDNAETQYVMDGDALQLTARQKPSPDPSRWPGYPMVELGFGFPDDATPRTADRIESISVTVYGFADPRQSFSTGGADARKYVTELKLSLDGARPSVEMTTEGQVEAFHVPVAWKLKLSAEVVVRR